MISNQSINAVMTSAQALTDSSLVVEAVPGSPLSNLVYHCLPLHAFGVQATTEGGETLPAVVSDGISDLSLRSQYKDLNGLYPHDEAMSEFVEMATRVIEANFNLTKNVVNPMIIKVVEDATSYADARARSAASPMNVVAVYFPAPYNNQALREIISRYEESVANDMKLTLIFPPMTADAIREAALTSIPSLDADIKTWLGNLPDSELTNTYNDIFGERPGTFGEKVRDRTTRAGRALLTFLLVRHFIDEVPEGLNIGLRDYQIYMASLAEQAGLAVAQSFRSRQDMDRANTLILQAPYPAREGMTSGNVLVNGDVYNRWLKQGGVPESMFGAVHAGSEDKSYNHLLDNAENFVSVWTRAARINKVQIDIDRFNHFLEGMRQALLNQLSTLPEDYRGTTEDRIYKERLTDHLARVKEGGVDEPWAIARKLVCRVFFPNSEAERVSWAVADACKNHPDASVREAILIAALDMVPEWVSKQFKVTNVRLSA